MNLKFPKRIPKTNAEHMREYRNRKKQLLQVNASTSLASTSIPTRIRQPRCKYIIEPSFVPCENLIVGRLSFHGMNPEIERILELELQADHAEVVNEKDVSDFEMASRYNILVGTVSRKFNSKRDRGNLQECDTEQRIKKVKFMKPDCD
ncbi:M-phase phosphoprotein 6 isoform X2 [Zootermopsis nevadensis]|uniref:M-phase phosphoprotein 6 isoform X2 n=1 Tax=Zootermopsis nevadensis TaxID=136037 RepID=UPI000B8EAB6C|nr:M-phase phosphoprotein 6 isoform X2 [Zootermopsis nevadensis]